MNSLKYILSIFAIALMISSCEPVQDPEIELPAPPEAPEFTIEAVADNPNLIVVNDISSGFFDRIWDFTGATPAQSTLKSDTIFYGTAGTYSISLYASKEGGGGVGKNTKTVTIAEDAVVTCDPTIALLTGDCTVDGKCWTFSQVSGAVTVGPVPGSSEWFSSPESGLVPEQYDDFFCFYFEGGSFIYMNNGQTVNPYNGFEAEDFTPPSGQTWFYDANGGETGGGLITLPEEAFLGVMDSGPVYDVVTLTETELVVRSPIRNSDGFFDLYFVSN